MLMPNRTPAQAQVDTLLRVADRDWEAALSLMQYAPHLYEGIGFHLQQATEKYLKAALHVSGQPAPFIHDLASLATDLAPHVAFDADDVSAAIVLTVFAVRLRYTLDNAPPYSITDLSAMAERFRTKLRPLAQAFLV